MEAIYKKITALAAHRILAQQGFLLDVRSAEEFKTKHLTHAINLPLENVFNDYYNTIPNKNTPVIVYCSTGARSKIAALFLLDLGYKQVYDLGAMNNWQNA